MVSIEVFVLKIQLFLELTRVLMHPAPSAFIARRGSHDVRRSVVWRRAGGKIRFSANILTMRHTNLIVLLVRVHDQ